MTTGWPVTAGYADWPFWPDKRSDEQQEWWWRDCHYETAADRQLQGVYHWFLLAGPPGSGKTVARWRWQRREHARSLCLDYPPGRWPGAPDAWFSDNRGHLPQMMAVAGQIIAEHLIASPERLGALDEFQREFLRALLEFMNGERHYRRFLSRLPRPLAEELRDVAPVDVFGGQALRHVQEQIEELAGLARGLGFERVVYVVDPPTPLGPADAQGLAELFGWLDLADHPGLAVVAVVPQSLLEGSSVLARARGRASLVYTDWTMAECHIVAGRCLRQAAPDLPADALAALLPPDGLRELDALVAAEHHQPNPGVWVGLAETLLYLTRRDPEPMPVPLRPEDMPRLRATYYRRHVTLWLDPERRLVWRGATPLSIQDQPLNFLQTLLRLNRMVRSSDEALQHLGESENIHSLASRARAVIEPVEEYETYLHLRRGRGGGYWLENCRSLAEPLKPVTGR